MGELITVQGVHGRLRADGIAELNLEDVSWGLGFTKVDKKGTQIYTRINKQALRHWLQSFGILDSESELPEFIPENIFYKLCFKAENQVAREFQDKVTDEILPAIRKYGAYMTPETIEKALLNPDTIIKIATQLKREQKRRQQLEAQIKVDKPKVLFAEAVSASSTTILVRELATVLRQNGIQIGEKRLFEQLRELGYLIKRFGTDRNMPTQKSMELGLFEIKETTVMHSDGHVSVGKTPKVTGKGQVYFINLFKRLSASKEVAAVKG